jgi:hypothetical protein
MSIPEDGIVELGRVNGLKMRRGGEIWFEKSESSVDGTVVAQLLVACRLISVVIYSAEDPGYTVCQEEDVQKHRQLLAERKGM